jgi:hypothetical protein
MDSFSIPKRSGVAVPLIEKAQAGQLSREHLAAVQQQLERLHQQMAADLSQDDPEVESFLRDVLDCLADAFNLMHFGLDEMGQFLGNGDASHLRMGRLLLEKGEQEYLAIQKELRRVERAASPAERTVNLWGQLLELARSDADEDDLGEALAQAESAMEAQLDGTLRDFSLALDILRSNPDEAQRKMKISLIRFNEFLGLTI